jgi:hypothetical protein
VARNLVYPVLSDCNFIDQLVLVENLAALALPERKVYDQFVLAGRLELVTIGAVLLSTLSKN